MSRVLGAVEVLGTTDDVTECWRCGRTHLKKTVAIRVDGTDEEVQFLGVVCAAQVIGCGALELLAVASAVQSEKDAQEARERAEKVEVAFRSWEAFCEPYGGIQDAIDHFGGFAEARSAWRGVVVP